MVRLPDRFLCVCVSARSLFKKKLKQKTLLLGNCGLMCADSSRQALLNGMSELAVSSCLSGLVMREQIKIALHRAISFTFSFSVIAFTKNQTKQNPKSFTCVVNQLFCYKE